MQSWWPMWPGFGKLPLSGDVAQAIAPLTNWFSPTIEMNFAGDRRIEADVVSNVASYGKQLGMLTDAVLALSKVTKDGGGEAVARLAELAGRIEACKKRYNSGLEQQAREALERLQKADPAACKRVIRDVAS